MRKFIKSMTFVVLFVFIFYGCVHILDDAYLPDNVYLYEDDEFEYGQGLLTIKTDKKDLAEASATAGNSYNARLYLFDLIPLKTVRVTTLERTYLIPGGMTFGVKMFTAGVILVGMGDVHTAGGKVCPAKRAGLELGDVIISVDGKTVNGNDDLAAIVLQSEGRPLKVVYCRGDVKMTTRLTPANAKDGTGFKAGMWVRDSSAGIGTVTYINEKTGIVAGLGHGVTDADTGTIMPVGSGELVPVHITGITKGQVGTPGELRGAFGIKTPIATLDYNCDAGVYGTLTYEFYDAEPLPVAFKQDVKAGKALVLCTIDDRGPKYYEIEIESLNLSESTPTKNLVVKITDPALIAATGGIVQGMSGSPIVQNGRIVGALTHVFVNDPTKGYGIFIENMLYNERNATSLRTNHEVA